MYRGVSWYILIDSGVLHRRYPIMVALREDQETVCIEKWPRRYLDNYIIWRILIRRKVLRDNGPFSTISGTCRIGKNLSREPRRNRETAYESEIADTSRSHAIKPSIERLRNCKLVQTFRILYCISELILNDATMIFLFPVRPTSLRLSHVVNHFYGDIYCNYFF